MTSPILHPGEIKKIDSDITSFLTLYKVLYGNLTYKFHNATHVKRLIKNNGTLTQCHTIRYKSNHRLQKLVAVSTDCRKNLPETICIKNQLQSANLSFTESFCAPEVVCHSYEPINDRQKTSLFPQLDRNVQMYETERLTYKGCDYAVGMILVCELGIDDIVNVAKILDIFFQKDEVFFKLKRFRTLYYDDNYGAYLVEESQSIFRKNHKELPDVHPCLWAQKADMYVV